MSKDFQVFLRKELLRRTKENPRYSQRAFARHLGVSQSFLSKVLMGKKNISEETLNSMSAKLKIDEGSLKEFKNALLENRQKRRQQRFRRGRIRSYDV